MKSLDSLGAAFCKRGSLPCFLANSAQSLRSTAIALSESVFMKVKWVTFMNVLRFLCECSLECSEALELPMYTISPLYNNLYTPDSFGARLTKESVKEYGPRHFAMSRF